MTALFDPRSGGFLDLSARRKLRLTGADRLRFLNGQLTNDANKASTSVAVPACLLNTKGRIDAQVFVSATADAFWIDADSELREKLPARLERYIIADDVVVEDVTNEWALFHVLSAAAPSLSAKARVLSVERFRETGWDIWVEAAQHDQIFEALSEGLAFCDDSCANVFRIERGVPHWTRELNDEINPIEANLELSCVDYEKGCYIGQEVISRMKMSGQRLRKLCGFISVHGAPLEAGMKLFPIGEQKESGWITSAARSKRLGQEIALGYIKRPFPPAGFKLDAIDPENTFGAPPVRVEMTDLPFPGG